MVFVFQFHDFLAFASKLSKSHTKVVASFNYTVAAPPTIIRIIKKFGPLVVLNGGAQIRWDYDADWSTGFWMSYQFLLIGKHLIPARRGRQVLKQFAPAIFLPKELTACFVTGKKRNHVGGL
jgi:hypothetical protein